LAIELPWQCGAWSVFVVDARLVIKWFVPEVDSDAARRWLDAPHDYIYLISSFRSLGRMFVH